MLGEKMATGGVLYGTSGYGGAYAATGNKDVAMDFALGSAAGGALSPMMGFGTVGTMGTALSTGIGNVAINAQDGGGGGGGGGYTGPQGGDPNAGTGSQKKATKSVPESEFLDGGGGRWGNSGMGGVFAGLDNLGQGDNYVDTEKIKKKYAQRKSGEFVNR